MAAPTGITGMTGLQGLRGLEGPPRYAFRGPPFGYTTARLTTSTPTGDTGVIYLTPQNLGTWYNLTADAVGNGNPAPLTIHLPGYNPTYGLGPTGTISSAIGRTTHITYTTTTPVADLGLRANALITITGTLNNPTNVIPTGQVRILPAPTGPTGSTFSVAATTNTSTSSSGAGAVQETTAVETTNEAFPTPEQAGNFWLFKNNDDKDMSITFSNGSPIYRGSAVTSLTLERSHKMTVLYTGSNFIVL
jgi:hypothetical protein